MAQSFEDARIETQPRKAGKIAADPVLAEAQRLVGNQKTPSEEYFNFDDEEAMDYLEKFVTEKRSIPEYASLWTAAQKERDSPRGKELQRILTWVDDLFSFEYKRQGYEYPPIPNTLLLRLIIDGEIVSKSVYVCLRNAVFSLLQQKLYVDFIRDNRRAPENDELNKYIIDCYAPDFDQYFPSKRDMTADEADWCFIFHRVVYDALQKVVTELVRLVNLVGIVKLQKVPTTVAEVEELIRKERMARKYLSSK